MSDNTPWWEGLTQEEIETELAQEARQNRLAEEAYQELLNQPDARIAHTDEF